MTLLLIMGCDLNSPEDYLRESNKLADQGKYNEAIVLLDKALLKKPKYKEAWLNRGLYNEILEKFESAIKDYETLLKFDSKNTTALYGIGTCKYDLKLFTDAIEYYNKALETKGYSTNNDTSNKSSIIIDWNTNGLIEDKKFDVNSNEIFYYRGLAYYQLNKFRSAYNDFYNCLTQNYNPPECHYMIGLCFIASGNKEKGCEEFNKAIFFGDTLSMKAKLEHCK